LLFKSLLETAQHFSAYVKLPISETRVSNQKIAAKLRTVVTLIHGKFLHVCAGKFA